MMSAKICAYCHREECGCGARQMEYGDARDIMDLSPEKSYPFPLNGYIVWPCSRPWNRDIEFVFYNGIEQVGTIVISHENIRNNVPEGERIEIYLWRRFLEDIGEDKSFS